ncbi:MAG: hypothetical protein FVQ82_16295 [Planctomycetes bacterium]|nr:hypothetical protein [Planctomycetota bacterium]
MGKQILGVLLLLAGLGWAYIWREDPTEGPIMRATGFFIAISGSILFLTGIKQEIIEAIKDAKAIQEKQGNKEK